MTVHDAKANRSTPCFIIEDTLRFYPDSHSFYNIRTQEVVSILSTASGCLRLLIEEQGGLLTKEQLIEQVWGKRGIVISPNTFYQTMLSLRRGLENAGMQNTIISTHYGKGVTISKEIKITRCSGEMSEPLQDTGENEQNTLNAAAISAVIPNPKNASSSISVFLNRYKTKGFFFGLAAFFSAVIMYFVFHHFSVDDDFFSIYRKSDVKINECNVYFNPDFMNETSLNYLVKSGKIKCENDEQIFISLIEPVERLSVIHCKKNYSSEEQCLSDFHLD